MSILTALVLAALVLACCGVTWLNLRGGAR